MKCHSVNNEAVTGCAMQHVTAMRVAGTVVTVHSISMTPGMSAVLPCSVGGTSMMANATCNVTVLAVSMTALTATSSRASASKSFTQYQTRQHKSFYDLT